MSRVAAHVTVVLACLAAGVLLWQLRSAVLILAASLSLAAALRRPIDRLVARRIPQGLAITMSYALTMAVLAAIGAFGVGKALSELAQAGDDWVEAYEWAVDTWPEGNRFQRIVARRLPPPDELYAAPTQSDGVALIETTLGLTFNAFRFAVEVVVVVVMSIYWNIDRAYFERLWLSLLPLAMRTRAVALWRSIESEVGAYFASEILQCLLAACVLGMGFRAMGYRYPALAAVACAAAWLIPWVGIALAMASVLLLSLPGLVVSHGASLTTTTFMAALYTLAVLLVLEIVVEPRIFNRKRYNSLLVALVAAGLTEFLGLFGLVLGPPLAAIVQILNRHWLLLRSHETTAAGRPPIAKIDERLKALSSALEQVDSPSPELVSFTRRLNELCEQAGRIPESANGREFSCTVFTLPPDTVGPERPPVH